MWIMTHFGILMPALRPKDTVLPGDERVIQIRSRRARDLNYLRDHFAPYLGKTIALGNTDYQYRVYCTRDDLADIMAKLALDMDYVKFKETAEVYHGDKKLHDVYMRIWSIVLDAFETGSLYARHTLRAAPKNQSTRKQRRADRKAARRNGTGWKNAWVDVDEDALRLDSAHNEYADANPKFRKHWWEDIDAAN